jgi:glycosyltransferase involved in cell wall biosynthesis
VGHPTPVLGIGLPVYNGERFLGQAIQSLLAQDFADFELFISDNASIDGTEAICRHYAASDGRITYRRNPVNLGPTANFNRAFESVSGEYFMWAAADDYWEPDYLSSCHRLLRESPRVVLAGTMGTLVDAETSKPKLVDPGLSTVGLGPAQRFKHYKATIHGGTHVGVTFYGVYRRHVLRAALPMKNLIANDHLVLAQLCMLGEFDTVRRPLMVKRWGGFSRSYPDIARTLNLDGVRASMPLLVREGLLQTLLMTSRQLSLFEKATLSGWSLLDYIRIHGRAEAARFLRSHGWPQ